MNAVSRYSLAASSAGMLICYQKANNIPTAICMDVQLLKPEQWKRL